MSSEIRAGSNRTYWVISNGNSYVDGVTDPELVTTVGNGWHVSWIGTEYSEYILACQNHNIIPRNSNPDIPSISTIQLSNDKLSARQVRLWIVKQGISLKAVEDAIQNIEDPVIRDNVSIEWEYAPYIERNHPMLNPLAQSLGLSEADIDRAFVEGSSI